MIADSTVRSMCTIGQEISIWCEKNHIINQEFCIREESMRPYSVFTNAGKLMEKALPDHSRKYLISSC